MSDLVRDPNEVALLAAEKEGENWAFRAWLKGRYGYDDEGLMSVVRDLADYVASQIDCTDCANCCRQLDTYLSDEDIERLARSLGVDNSEFQAAYLQAEAEVGEESWCLPAPCPLLEGKMCRAYAARPDPCRAYPHLHSDFIAHSIRRIEGTFICPVVYNVVEGMKDLLRWRS